MAMDFTDFNSKLQDRMKKVLQDEEFMKFCQRERNREDFDEILTNSLKVASINVSNIHENNSLIAGVYLFSAEQIKNDVIDFYTALDNLAPNGINLMDRLNENVKYIRTEPKFLGERSYCFSGRDENGNKQREIFINLEGRIGDTGTAMHELCHSCCVPFVDCIGPKDKRVGEIPAIIIDHLSTRFLKKKYPQYQRIPLKVINLAKN